MHLKLSNKSNLILATLNLANLMQMLNLRIALTLSNSTVTNH